MMYLHVERAKSHLPQSQNPLIYQFRGHETVGRVVWNVHWRLEGTGICMRPVSTVHRDVCVMTVELSEAHGSLIPELQQLTRGLEKVGYRAVSVEHGIFGCPQKVVHS